MHDSSTVSAPAALLTLERSRLLGVWWPGLHLLIWAALLMANPLLAVLGGPVLAAHLRLKLPLSPPLIVISGSRFGLPAEGRFDLALAAGTRIGAWAALLEFSDRPGSRRLVVRDQLDAPGWRRLRLAITRPR